jgi:hypothetical protein
MKYFSSSPIVKAMSHGRPGLAGGALYTLMGGVAGWIMLMLVSPAVRDLALERMHLATRSFPSFAAQQMVPAMYNFANQGHVDAADLPYVTCTQQPDFQPHYYNHFPVRNLTWELRDHYFTDRWGYYSSRFQGRELRTRYRLARDLDGGWSVVRLESTFSND